MFLTWNHGDDNETEIIHKKSKFPRLPYLSFSDDDGLTWSEPKNMKDSCRNSSWGWYATGPGVGIQIKKGKFKGRLVIPSNHSYDDINGKIRNGPFNYGAHVLFSDNNGSSWEISDSIFPGCNESQIVELGNGDLMMNMRSYNNQFSRAYSISSDGGYSWSKIKHEYQIKPQYQLKQYIKDLSQQFENESQHMSFYYDSLPTLKSMHLSVPMLA